MRHTRLPFATLLTALFTLFAGPLFAGDCMRLCDLAFMQSATAEDIQAEIDKGADIGAGDEEGYTPLHFAAYWGNAETVTALLNAGANGKARTEDDKTPFDLAKEEGKLNGTDAYWLLNEAQY